MVRNVPEISDETALKLAAQGDQEAFGVLYERYVGRIYSYIYYRTGNQHDAEDLTARVFFRALRHVENYKDRGLPLSAWLYRIAHNLVANWHRDNSRRREVPLDEIILVRHGGDLPEVVLIENEEKENLLTQIEELKRREAELMAQAGSAGAVDEVQRMQANILTGVLRRNPAAVLEVVKELGISKEEIKKMLKR